MKPESPLALVDPRLPAVPEALPQAVLDGLTAATAQACATAVAWLALGNRSDARGARFASSWGMAAADVMPDDVGFCDLVTRSERAIEIADVRHDSRFAAVQRLPGDLPLRFRAGAPISTPTGEHVGVLCVAGVGPRRLEAAQLDALQQLAAVAGTAIAEHRQQAAQLQALAASEAGYRAIVESQSELISLAQRDGTLTFVNAACARHFGLEPAQLLGRNLLDFVDLVDRSAVRTHWDNVCASRAPAEEANRMVSVDGRPRWVAWTNVPLLDAAGEVVAMQSVGRDVTRQKLAEGALAESEQRHRRLYEATPAALHSIDTDGRILTVSDSWLRLLGYERVEVLGRRTTDFMTPESATRALEQVLPEYWHAGRCERLEFRLLHKNGTPVDVLLSATVEHGHDGAPRRSIAVLENVTESKRLALELSRTHARLDAIVDNVPAQLGHWDRDGVTRFANREFQAAFGLPMEHIVDRPLADIFAAVDPKAYAQLAPRIAEVLQGRRQEFELAMLTTSGLRQLRLTLVPDQPRHGEVAGFFGMAHDMTGRKALELRLSDSELRYRSLFDHLNSGFALHDIVVDATGKPVDYRFLALNAAFTAVTGLDAAQTVGKRVTEVLPGIERDPADWIGRYGEVALTGRPVHFEQRSEGLGRWFEVVAYRPAPGQFAVITQDITQRKHDELRLQQALGEKETLLKEVYHRVKNNLQVVESLLKLQGHSIADGLAREALAQSVQRIRAMALVHEKLYRSGSLATVSLPDYAHDLLRQIGDATGAAQRGVVLEGRVEALETGLDSAIPFGLLLAELVSNAMKHAFAGRAGGMVRVTVAAQTGGSTLLTVADDGVGLPPGFDPAGSASMGLQLATSLARQLGGELRVGRGTVGATFQALLTRL